MGLVDEILQGLPTNPALREKVSRLEEQKAAAETENAILKDDNRELKAENERLKKQIEDLTHKDDLHATETQFLKAIATHDSLTAEALAQLFQLHQQRVQYFLEKLEGRGFTDSFSPFGADTIHSLTPKGREYMVEQNLL
jgi:hypothetical protein